MGTTLLLFETETERVHAINFSAKVIWNSMSSGPRSVDDLVRNVSEVFPRKEERELHADITDFVAVLHDKGLASHQETRTSRGREYYFDRPSAVAYEKPVIRSYTRDWLRQNHPGSFYNVMFSDTWGPTMPALNEFE